MRREPTIQLVKAAPLDPSMRAADRSSTLLAAALQNVPQPAALPQPKACAASVPRFLPIPRLISTKRCKIERKTGQITGNSVFARTSASDGPPQAPTSPSASQQNAPASPPLADTRRPAHLPLRVRSLPVLEEVFTRHSPALPALTQEGSEIEGSLATRHCLSLIYGTGIKKLWKPTPINEYKLLIYGKPRLSISSFLVQTHLGRERRAVGPSPATAGKLCVNCRAEAQRGLESAKKPGSGGRV
jgi:hypothetical protein